MGKGQGDDNVPVPLDVLQHTQKILVVCSCMSKAYRWSEFTNKSLVDLFYSIVLFGVKETQQRNVRVEPDVYDVCRLARNVLISHLIFCLTSK